MRQRSEEIRRVIERRPPGFALLSYLEKRAADAGVKTNIRSMNLLPPVSTGAYEETAVEMKLDKLTMKQLTDFLYLVELPEETDPDPEDLHRQDEGESGIPERADPGVYLSAARSQGAADMRLRMNRAIVGYHPCRHRDAVHLPLSPFPRGGADGLRQGGRRRPVSRGHALHRHDPALFSAGICAFGHHRRLAGPSGCDPPCGRPDHPSRGAGPAQGAVGDPRDGGRATAARCGDGSSSHGPFPSRDRSPRRWTSGISASTK